MTIADNVCVQRDILASGGFSVVHRGTYMGHPVAVKTLMVAEQDAVVKIRKVSIGAVVSAG